MTDSETEKLMDEFFGPRTYKWPSSSNILPMPDSEGAQRDIDEDGMDSAVRDRLLRQSSDTEEDDAPTQRRTGAGNTKDRSRAWCFTLNNPVKHGFPNADAVTQLFADLKMLKYCFQLEKGKNGTPHYQGVVYFENDLRFSTLQQLCTKIHWEVCKDYKASVIYCMKEEGRIRGPFVHGIYKAVKEVPWFLIKELRPWQQKIVDLVKEPCTDERSIHWYWEEQGNVGKTALGKYLAFHHHAIVLGGKAADMKYAIADRMEKGQPTPIIVMDLSRTMEAFISYEGIEAIKNGFFFSTKYKSGQVLMAPPHVIVFANFRPNEANLSSDRWKIKELTSFVNATASAMIF
nr:MAG: replication associated protein [Cressdnaviricota sp.]